MTAVSSEACGPINAATGTAPGAKAAYVRVSTFNKQTQDSFLKQWKELKEDGTTEFVLDLRNNGGGYFPAGVQVLHSNHMTGHELTGHELTGHEHCRVQLMHTCASCGAHVDGAFASQDSADGGSAPALQRSTPRSCVCDR